MPAGGGSTTEPLPLEVGAICDHQRGSVRLLPAVLIVLEVTRGGTTIEVAVGGVSATRWKGTASRQVRRVLGANGSNDRLDFDPG